MPSPLWNKLLGPVQMGVAVAGMLVAAASSVYGFIASKSCAGIGCTSALFGLLIAVAGLAVSLLALPAWAWIAGNRWALPLNLVMLLPLIVVGWLLLGIAGDVRPAPASQ